VRGVVFGDYDVPGLATVDGIAEIDGATEQGQRRTRRWFRDGEGDMLGVGTADPLTGQGRRVPWRADAVVDVAPRLDTDNLTGGRASARGWLSGQSVSASLRSSFVS
jgi:hypothetical protein